MTDIAFYTWQNTFNKKNSERRTTGLRFQFITEPDDRMLLWGILGEVYSLNFDFPEFWCSLDATGSEGHQKNSSMAHLFNA